MQPKFPSPDFSSSRAFSNLISDQIRLKWRPSSPYISFLFQLKNAEEAGRELFEDDAQWERHRMYKAREGREKTPRVGFWIRPRTVNSQRRRSNPQPSTRLPAQFPPSPHIPTTSWGIPRVWRRPCIPSRWSIWWWGLSYLFYTFRQMQRTQTAAALFRDFFKKIPQVKIKFSTRKFKRT